LFVSFIDYFGKIKQKSRLKAEVGKVFLVSTQYGLWIITHAEGKTYTSEYTQCRDVSWNVLKKTGSWYMPNGHYSWMDFHAVCFTYRVFEDVPRNVPTLWIFVHAIHCGCFLAEEGNKKIGRGNPAIRMPLPL
jgi:hypothetical protein